MDEKKTELQEFHFRPETQCKTPEEFSKALTTYAKENGVKIVITKESMYPEFTMDGVTYKAKRIFSQNGTDICCQQKVSKKSEENKEKNPKRYIKYAIGLALFLFILFGEMSKGKTFWEVLPLSIGVVIFIFVIIGNYRKNRKKK